MIEYTLLFAALYVVSKELEQHGHDSKFPKDWGKWWNNKTAWRNKHTWKPTFLFKTALVFLTDAEHLFQMISNVSIACAVGFASESITIGLATWAVMLLFHYIMNEKILKLKCINDQ